MKSRPHRWPGPRRYGALLGLVVAFLAAGAPAQTAIVDRDPRLQGRFIEALARLQADDPDGAAALFEELATLTPSPRVRLEWGRALFLAGRLAESRQVFRQVLELPALPWQVEENVRRFLDRIDRAIGSVDVSLGVITDTNPMSFTSVRQVELLGMILNVVPPDGNDTVTGLQYGLEAFAPIGASGRWSGHLEATFADYPMARHDELHARAELLLDLRGDDRWLLKAGSEVGVNGAARVYRMSYLAGRYGVTRSRDRLSAELQTGEILFDRMTSLDGPRHALNLTWSRHLPLNRSIALSLGASRAVTRHPADSSRSLSTGVRWTHPTRWRQSRAEPYLRLSGTRHEAPHPLFGGLREDRRATVGFVWIAKGMRLFGLTPRIGLSVTRNDSSLPYFSYDKGEFTLRLE